MIFACSTGPVVLSPPSFLQHRIFATIDSGIHAHVPERLFEPVPQKLLNPKTLVALYKTAVGQAGYGFANETRSRPMGESKLKLAKCEEMRMSRAGVQAMAGRVQARWDTASAATSMGQLACFIEFLNLTRLWSRWLESCPLAYGSPKAPSKAAALGTWMLSVRAVTSAIPTSPPSAATGSIPASAWARSSSKAPCAMLQGWVVARAAEQLSATIAWNLVCDYLKGVLVGGGPPQGHRFLENHANGAG